MIFDRDVMLCYNIPVFLSCVAKICQKVPLTADMPGQGVKGKQV